MKPDITPLEPGLYFVATPIGNARDITLRALDILAAADVIAAEDTRTTRKLLEMHGVPTSGRQMIAYHDHSGPNGRAGILKLLGEGKSIAYASEAGTPMIADPGFALAREAADAGYLVTSAPGASALPTALSLSGLPTDRFLFAGFAPSAAGQRKTWLTDLLATPATTVMFESPKRIQKTLGEICDIAGDGRRVAICRELTKKFEEVLRGTAGELRDILATRALKGEIVVVIDRGHDDVSEDTMEDALRKAMADMSLKDAAAAVAEAYGLPKRKVYQAALALEKE